MIFGAEINLANEQWAFLVKFAATNGLSEDNSGIFVWVFLGFCALIVVAQVIPAVLLMTGMVKGAVSAAKGEMVPVATKS